MKAILLVTVITGILALGCTPTIKVEMPEKPMEINLNVKVDHKIKIEVDKELEDVMDNNDDIF